MTRDVCCFCGEVVDPAGSDRIQLSARWVDGGQERTQSWGAHRKCLDERMHDPASAEGQ